MPTLGNLQIAMQPMDRQGSGLVTASTSSPETGWLKRIYDFLSGPYGVGPFGIGGTFASSQGYESHATLDMLYMLIGVSLIIVGAIALILPDSQTTIKLATTAAKAVK